MIKKPWIVLKSKSEPWAWIKYIYDPYGTETIKETIKFWINKKNRKDIYGYRTNKP